MFLFRVTNKGSSNAVSKNQSSFWAKILEFYSDIKNNPHYNPPPPPPIKKKKKEMRTTQ